jgi:aldehyde dehydrogenase (NAD+)
MVAGPLYEREYFLIGGQRAAPVGEGKLDVICPSTEAPAGRVPLATAADIDAAVAAARRAFDEGPWPRLPLEERARVLLAAHDALVPLVAEISELTTAEMGVPITVATNGLTPRAIGTIPVFVELARTVALEEERPGRLADALVLREPVGVVAAIAPWNAPVLNTIAKLAPALLMGCTVVYKPAPETPLDAYYFVEALHDAGIPAGVVNLVPGGREVGEHLVGHPGVDKVSFTGSTAAGRRVGAICGEQFKRMTLELGGKSAAIVLDDADLAQAELPLQLAAFGNSGQICVSYSRVLAPRSRYDEVVDLLARRAEGLVVGDPFAPETTMGPLVAERQRARVEGYITSGIEEGARVVTGGGRPPGLDTGWFVEPTVFADVSGKMRIAREEIFGPVVAVLPYDTEEDAVRVANDSDYGLHGAVFTASAERGVAVARKIRTGTFTVNGYLVNFDAPFGGVKCSGVGREFSLEGILSCTELKTVNFPHPARS